MSDSALHQLSNELPFSEEEIKQLQKDDNTFLHPWEVMSLIGKNKRCFMERGDGVYLYDQRGHKLLDGPAGMWCMSLGYGRKDIARVAAEQIEKMSYFSPFNMTSSVSVKFANELVKYTPGDLKHVFFTNSGSEAVDASLRFMQFYHNLIGKPTKKKIIAREKGYHGSTFLTHTITGRERWRRFVDKYDEIVIFISAPNPYFRPDDMSEEKFLQNLLDELEQTIKTHGADNIGAFIAEPIQASGGVIVPPKGYLKAVREICKKHEILYISDEVVVGFGRMGEVFASEKYFGIVPDIITSAKGLTAGYVPMGAFFVSDKLLERITAPDSLGAKESAMFTAGYTYSGHPLAAAVGMKVLELLHSEKILDHVKSIAPYFQKKLRELEDIPIVGDVRGEGLLGGIELVADRKSNHKDDNALLSLDIGVGSMVDKYCYEMGLIVRPIVNLCVMSPPLTINKEQIDFMVDTLRTAVLKTMADLQKQGVVK